MAARPSAPDFVARFEKVERQTCDGCQCARDQTQTQPRRDIAHPEKAKPKAVDHVKERVQMAEGLPKWRQGMDNIQRSS